jgi:hypothetical protein
MISTSDDESRFNKRGSVVLTSEGEPRHNKRGSVISIAEDTPAPLRQHRLAMLPGSRSRSPRASDSRGSGSSPRSRPSTSPRHASSMPDLNGGHPAVGAYAAFASSAPSSPRAVAEAVPAPPPLISEQERGEIVSCLNSINGAVFSNTALVREISHEQFSVLVEQVGPDPGWRLSCACLLFLKISFLFSALALCSAFFFAACLLTCLVRL